MKTRNFLCVMMLVLLPPLMAANAGAQTTRELVANIPFDFTVCRQTLPAGKYRITPFSSTNSFALLVRSTDGRSTEIVCTHDVQGMKPVTEGRLIFNRYGDQYFLSELWFPGARIGNQLVKTEQEEAILRELRPQKKRGRVTVKITEAKPT